MVRLKLNFHRVEFFRQRQKKPTLHVYFLHTGIGTIERIELKWSDFGNYIELEMPMDHLTSTDVCRSAVLAFDLYVHTLNSEGVWCRMHRASANIFLKDAQTRLHKSQSIKVPIGNVWANTNSGNVEVDFGDALQKIQFDDTPTYFEDPKKGKEIQERFTGLIRGEMGLFQGFWAIRSKNEFLKRVHAPIFNGRMATMPGFAYLMNSTHFSGDQMWYLHWYKAALKRCDLEDEQVASIVERQFKLKTAQIVEGFHLITALMATMVSATVTCYPYECDFYVQGGEQKPFESFDNIFVRKAGDCEDFGRGMHLVFSTFCAMNLPRVHRGLRALQRVCRLYVSGVVLGTVSQNSHGASVFKTRQAHMYLKLFPIEGFTKRIAAIGHHNMESIKLPLFEEVCASKPRPWMAHLRVYTLEGTAPVQPFTSLSTMNAEVNLERQKVELQSATKLRPPRGLARLFRPQWGVFEDPFYDTDCHVYTDFFLERGYGMGSFAMYDTKMCVYGVPMQQVLNMQNLAFVPHQIVSSQDLETIGTMLTYEHPMPIMTSSCTLGKRWSDDKEVDALVGKFAERLGRTGGTAKDDALYNEFFVTTPQQLTKGEMDSIVEFLDQRTVDRQVFVEGIDPEEMVLRVRAYGLV